MSGEISVALAHLKLTKKQDDEDVVDPWNVMSKSETGVNYDKLIREYLILSFQ